MSQIEECSHNFYVHIAKLLYAVAYIDGEIREEEETTMKRVLEREWLQKYKGKSLVVEEILQSYEEIKTADKDAEECFYEFVQYKEAHESLFSNPMRNTLWEVSCEIADSVHKKNKSELILLAHLGKHLGIMK